MATKDYLSLEGLNRYHNNLNLKLEKLTGSSFEVNNSIGNSFTDTYEGGAIVNQILGNSSQNQYTGKNLLCVADTYSYEGKNSIVCYYYSDQYFNAYGTATDDSEFSLISNFDEVNNIIAEGGTFCLSLNGATYHIEDCNIVLKYSYDNSEYEIPANGESFTIPSGGQLIDVVLKVKKDTQVNLTSVKIQLEKNTEATSYEKYNNKEVSPSPLAAQHIQYGNIESIHYCSKNMIQGSDTFANFSDGNWVWSFEDTYNGLTVASTPHVDSDSSYDCDLYSYTPCFAEKGQTYTFSAFVKTAENAVAVMKMVQEHYDDQAILSSNHKYINCTPEWQRFSFTVTCLKDGRIRPSVFGVTDGIFLHICGYQLELGSTMTNYITYQGEKEYLSNSVELNGIDDICDSIKIDSDGELVIYKKVDKYEITSSDDIYFEDGKIYVNLYGEFKPNGNLLCTIATNDPNSEHTTGYYCTLGSNGIYFTPNDVFSNDEEFRQYLENNGSIECLVELAYEEWTDRAESLTLEDKDLLFNVKTYDDNTVIDVNGMKLDITYGANQISAMILENKNEIANLKAVLNNCVKDAETVVTYSSYDTSNGTAWYTDDIYLNYVQNNEVRSSHKLNTLGTIKINNDGDGNITIEAPTFTLNGTELTITTPQGD